MIERMKEDHHEFLDIIFSLHPNSKNPAEPGRSVSAATWPKPTITLDHGPRRSIICCSCWRARVHSFRTGSVMHCVREMPSVFFPTSRTNTGPIRKNLCKKYSSLSTENSRPSCSRASALRPTPRTAQAYSRRKQQMACVLSWRKCASPKEVQATWAGLPVFWGYSTGSAVHRQPVSFSPTSPSPFQKGKEYMDIHFAGGITVEGVSAHAGVDRTHFAKQFRKAYGLSPVQYIQQLKMNQAKRLLVQTPLTLTEVAHSVGYPDLFSFSKAFKSRSGSRPTATA